jgi:dCMP deaminase
MDKKDNMYMDIAIRVSEMSYSTRKKVGAVLVKDNNILSFGWNGMPTGFDNCCEIGDVTNPEVIHAEMNVIAKLAKAGISCNNSTLYITLSPCFDCAKNVYQAGISKVIYLEEYRDTKPIEFLKKCNVEVVKMEKLEK